ncbi:MAG TPA: hypothetical protein VLA21_12070, partial [Candidatus Limnocylindria bacterium]|nr:hypothetical protein [Candidatus Limnocylindria bacterium]
MTSRSSSTTPTRGLDAAAGELREIIGSAGFIRRDRSQQALFVSDFPARAPAQAARLLERLAQSGWTAEANGGLCRMDFSPARFRAFFASLPRRKPGPGLAAILLPHAREASDDELPSMRRALLLWDAGDVAALSREAGRALGEGLRKKRGVPGFYPALL